MATEIILKCEHCRERFKTEPVKALLDGEEIHLCCFTCWIHWLAKLYHRAMASHATIHVSMKGENG